MSSRLFVWFTVAACGSSSSAKPDAMIDSGPDSASICSSVSDVSTAVERTQVATAMPAPTGGAIPDSKYTLTHWYVYTGPGGATGGDGMRQSQTTVVTGTKAHTAGTQTNGTFQLSTYTLAINGTALTVTQNCPTISNPVLTIDSFSQNGTVVTLYASSTKDAFEYSPVL
jgi:hypothetical protein